MLRQGSARRGGRGGGQPDEQSYVTGWGRVPHVLLSIACYLFFPHRFPAVILFEAYSPYQAKNAFIGQGTNKSECFLCVAEGRERVWQGG